MLCPANGSGTEHPANPGPGWEFASGSCFFKWHMTVTLRDEQPARAYGRMCLAGPILLQRQRGQSRTEQQMVRMASMGAHLKGKKKTNKKNPCIEHTEHTT